MTMIAGLLAWRAMCACGWAHFYRGERAAIIGAADHRADGCEGCDHVTAVEPAVRKETT